MASVSPFSALRQLSVDSLRAAGRPRAIHGLLEVDVTAARRRMRRWKDSTGESPSLTALVVWCVARAVAQHPEAAAFRLGRRRQVTFAEVDVCTLVERSCEGRAIGSPHVVRGAERRSYREIHDELRAVQQLPIQQEHGRYLRWLKAPSFLRRWWLRRLARSPWRWRSVAGTVCVTSVGMFGGGAGWGLPVSQFPLTVTVGGIARRPALGGDGRLEEREALCLTVTLDHDVIDGAAAARFARSLRELLEGADAQLGSTPAGGSAPSGRP